MDISLVYAALGKSGVVGTTARTGMAANVILPTEPLVFYTVSPPPVSPVCLPTTQHTPIFTHPLVRKLTHSLTKW